MEAGLVHDVLPNLDISGIRFLIIENVANLGCPSNYDLGETSYKNLDNSPIHLVNWKIMIRQVLSNRDDHISARIISKKFHNALSEIIIANAKPLSC